MLRIVPFEEIDKNKWNGTVHYSPNGNVYGYYWYLKSVIHEWDALVENDYQTVTPILRNPIKEADYYLLPTLGAYTINDLSKRWLSAIMDHVTDKNQSLHYPLNHSLTEYIDSQYKVDYKEMSSIDLIDNYNAIRESYQIDFDQIAKETGDNIKIGTGIKPEELVALIKTTDHQRNTLLRIMYNAMHRGLGFSSYVENKNGEKVAASFFINSHNKMTELCWMSTSDKYRYILMDLAIRNSARKPMSIVTHQYGEVEKNMGFQSQKSPIIQLRNDALLPFKKMLNMKY